MAARTSASFGVGATITALAVATLGFFVAFAVFYGKYSDVRRLLQTSQQEQADIVKGDERNRDDVRGLIDEAKKAGNKSLVGYLIESQEAVMRRVTGAGRDKPSDLAVKIDALGDEAKTTSMLALVKARDGRIESLERELASVDAARQAAVEDRKNEVARVTSITDSHQKTIDDLNKEIGQLREEINTYRQGADDFKANVDRQLESVRTAGTESEKRLKDQLDKANEEKLILENQLAVLRGQKNLAVVRAGDEAALVDGQVIGINSADKEVFLSIGRRSNVVLGMTFAVYPTAASIRPDENGEYPRGKANIEIINVGESSATGRIISEVRGNPVVKGDVVANAVFDPNKKYKFVVYGHFDTDRDGLATPLERDEIANMIRAWGGTVVDDLSGDADFVVLGSRPVLPARPGSSAPMEYVQDYIRREAEVKRYDDLYRQAVSTTVPLLNENRLYTLIGKTPASAGRR